MSDVDHTDSVERQTEKSRGPPEPALCTFTRACGPYYSLKVGIIIPVI